MPPMVAGPTPTAPTPDGHPDVRALPLLAGDDRTFVRSTWGRRMHLHHGDVRALAKLLTLDDVDHLLTGTTIRAPEVRLARDGQILPSGGWTQRASLAGQSLSGLADPRRLLAAFDEGATIVLQGLQRSWEPLARLLGDLEHELGHPCQANAYLTPASSRGFDRHHDAHDVFVVQTHGSKAWEVHDDDGQHDLVLEPGTALYLPAGTDHLAHTRDTVSLHVTIGVRQLTRRRVVGRAVQAVLDDLELDGRLPAGWLDDRDPVATDLATALAAVATALGERDPDALVADEAERFRTTRTSWLPGGLRDRVALEDLDDTTTVRRRQGHHARLRPDGDHVRVLLGDRDLRVPGWVEPALAAAIEANVLRPVDLAEWLDPTSRVVVVRRLVREGLFRLDP